MNNRILAPQLTGLTGNPILDLNDVKNIQASNNLVSSALHNPLTFGRNISPARFHPVHEINSPRRSTYSNAPLYSTYPDPDVQLTKPHYNPFKHLHAYNGINPSDVEEKSNSNLFFAPSQYGESTPSEHSVISFPDQQTEHLELVHPVHAPQIIEENIIPFEGTKGALENVKKDNGSSDDDFTFKNPIHEVAKPSEQERKNILDIDRRLKFEKLIARNEKEIMTKRKAEEAYDAMVLKYENVPDTHNLTKAEKDQLRDLVKLIPGTSIGNIQFTSALKKKLRLYKPKVDELKARRILLEQENEIEKKSRRSVSFNKPRTLSSLDEDNVSKNKKSGGGKGETLASGTSGGVILQLRVP